MRRINTILLLLGLVPLSLAPQKTVSSTSARIEACPEIVRQALGTTDRLCQGTGRNQACYGHITLQAQPQPDVTQLEFNQEGDIVDIDLLQTLRLSPMDMASEAWGIALLRLQANLPDSLPGKNITMLLFGDVEVTNQMTVATSLNATVNAVGNVNVRQYPTLDSLVIASLAPGQTVSANGRLADSSWVRVLSPEGGSGWVAGRLLTSTSDLQDLEVVEATSQYYGPMQAFYFMSGQNDSACAAAPDSGLLIQTPEGVANVTLLINEVDIQIGSTVYFQAQPGGNLTVIVVEGAAWVSALGITYKVPAGTQITVPLGEDFKPSGPPTPPTAYDLADVQSLPLSLLERHVTVHSPLSPEEVEAASQPAEPDATATQAGPGESGTGGGVLPNTVPPTEPPVPEPTEECSEKITICHNGHTLTVCIDAWPAFEAQGDTMGPCP